MNTSIHNSFGGGIFPAAGYYILTAATSGYQLADKFLPTFFDLQIEVCQAGAGKATHWLNFDEHQMDKMWSVYGELRTQFYEFEKNTKKNSPFSGAPTLQRLSA